MATGLITAIVAEVHEIRGPNGSGCRVLSIDAVQRIAAQTGKPLREVEIGALQHGITPVRYLRNQVSIGILDQIRLLEAKVAVIGQGGLGGFVAEILARAGVGRLVLIDGDRFEDHNLNRQLFCTADTIGQYKAERAATHVGRVNAAVLVEAKVAFLTPSNADQLIAGCDVVVDCLDNIVSRFDLESAAKRAGIPMASAAVAGYTGQVSTVFSEDTGIALIYGAREDLQDSEGIETVLGCPPQTVALVAAVQSSEVIKVLSGKTDRLLRNKLWVADLSDNTFEVFSLV
ncbi:MAG: HesA/MoeB/ThiF family protein [Desulfatitalea sp.]|nr:HesA/MoeB/ThiF family protein [Desulfatitalea sp.]NNK02439.1 HesA/MoeB/ThiF family protein [Desulfatitalea sp.]